MTRIARTRFAQNTANSPLRPASTGLSAYASPLRMALADVIATASMRRVFDDTLPAPQPGKRWMLGVPAAFRYFVPFHDEGTRIIDVAFERSPKTYARACGALA